MVYFHAGLQFKLRLDFLDSNEKLSFGLPPVLNLCQLVTFVNLFTFLNNFFPRTQSLLIGDFCKPIYILACQTKPAFWISNEESILLEVEFCQIFILPRI